MTIAEAMIPDNFEHPPRPTSPEHDPNHCSSCEIVLEYTTLANEFTQDLSLGLVGGMELLFLSIVSIWIISHGYKFLFGAFGKNPLFGFVSRFFLTGQEQDRSLLRQPVCVASCHIFAVA